MFRVPNIAGSVTVSTKHSKKKAGIWLRDKADELTLIAGGTIGFEIFRTNQVRSNVNSLSRTWVNPCPPGLPIPSFQNCVVSFSATHRSKDPNSAECGTDT